MRTRITEYDPSGLLEVPERRASQSVKWDYANQEDLLPLWVADMDFASPKEIREAIIRRAEHGVFGYTMASESLFSAFRDWVSHYQDWTISREEQLLGPGMMSTIRELILGLTSPGEGVIIQPPVYNQFASVIQNTGRVLLENPLILDSKSYRMDFEGLEQVAARKDARILLLCSPHNPVGRVWTEAELLELARIAKEQDLIILSDEIHADLLPAAQAFSPSAKFARENVVSIQSPGKSFNIPSLTSSQLVVPEPGLRERVKLILEKSVISDIGVFNLCAAEAGYQHGRAWLEAVMQLVGKNFESLDRFIDVTHLPLRRIASEGTYLAWVDVEKMQFALGMQNSAFQKRILKDCGVWLSPGSQYGPGGENFLRFNLACSPETLMEALNRIKRWWEDLEY